MLPHDKLDWIVDRLTRQIDQDPDDPALRRERARATLARAWFHDGGESDLHETLADVRRSLHLDSSSVESLVVGGCALALLDRPEPARRHLDEASNQGINSPLLHAAYGLLAELHHDATGAIRHFETSCRGAPGDWEPHALLGARLASAAQPGGRQRLIERAMFHLVRALELGPIGPRANALRHTLGQLCLMSGRLDAADALFSQLIDADPWRVEARYHLGLSAAQRGKHKRAVLYFRQHLAESEARQSDVLARIAACHLHLREPERARDACTRAIAIDSNHLGARWVLGSALVAEGRDDEAKRVLRELLEQAPGHAPAFAELVRMRTLNDDARWLRQALRSEVAVFDRLPAAGGSTSRHPDVTSDPRTATRERIKTLIKGLSRTDTEVITTVMSCIDLTTDEGLRFTLWESVLDLMARERVPEVSKTLQEPGATFSAASGREALLLAEHIPDEALATGLTVGEEDLLRAAVDRHGPADDVVELRQRVGLERREARAWQALLLLAIAQRSSNSGHTLLLRWAQDADEELGFAALTGLALLGDSDAAAQVRTHAKAFGLPHLADIALRPRQLMGTPSRPTIVSDDDTLQCRTCGKRGGQVSHMLQSVSGDVAVCAECLTKVARQRSDLATSDPTVRCALTGASLLDDEAVYVYMGVPISQASVDQSLGADERATVDRFVSAL
ncbi:MAG: tetratricopeptide repeat protein [Myxococcota bacterium]